MNIINSTNTPEKELTGYPSMDKPWLKYYKKEYIEAQIPHMSAYEYLKEKNKNHLDLNAIDSNVGNYTYKELFKMIEKTASSLYAMGMKKGKIALCMLPVLPHESFIFYAIDKIGAAMCQLPPQSTVEEICNSIIKFNSDIIFIFNSFLTSETEMFIYQNTNIKNIVEISFLPPQNRDKRTISWNEFLKVGNNTILPEIKRNPQELLFLAGTGGTTGTPKNVMLNDNCFNIMVHQIINSDLNYNAGDKWIRLWPLFSGTAVVSNHHLPLCIGANNLLREFPINLNDFDKMILEDKPNHVIMIPQLLDVLERSELLKDEDLSFIKTAGCGGLSITSQFEKRVNDFFRKHNLNTFLGYGWGCTENASATTIRSNFETTSIGTSGVPLVQTIVSVFDPETLNEKQYNEEGELCINSKTIMMGYYNDKELTNSVIKTHADGSTWLHTGDLGTISEDGIVTINGRMTRVIFVFPTAKIYPQALESMISRVSGVREVAVCAMPDLENEGFYLPICFIVADKAYNFEDIKEQINKLCIEELPEYSRPREILFKDFLPLTKVGKPDVKALEMELRDRTKFN